VADVSRFVVPTHSTITRRNVNIDTGKTSAMKHDSALLHAGFLGESWAVIN
jgi:hypothetical protein